MAGEIARMVLTDPPYNVPIDGHVCGLGRIRHRDFVMASGEMTERQFIQARRVRVTMPAWTSPNGHLVPARVEYRHNGARDHEKGLWLRLPAGAPAAGKARQR